MSYMVQAMTARMDIRLPQTVVNRIQAYADEEDRKPSDVARELIGEALALRDAESAPLSFDTLAEYAERVVEHGPPFTDEQIGRIAVILSKRLRPHRHAPMRAPSIRAG
jgi:predicted transcriptional regulator